MNKDALIDKLTANERKRAAEAAHVLARTTLIIRGLPDALTFEPTMVHATINNGDNLYGSIGMVVFEEDTRNDVEQYVKQLMPVPMYLCTHRRVRSFRPSTPELQELRDLEDFTANEVYPVRFKHEAWPGVSHEILHQQNEVVWFYRLLTGEVVTIAVRLRNDPARTLHVRGNIYQFHGLPRGYTVEWGSGTAGLSNPEVYWHLTTWPDFFTSERPWYDELYVTHAKARLEVLRELLNAEQISYDGLAELQSLRQYIEPGDAQLLEAAGEPQ